MPDLPAIDLPLLRSPLLTELGVVHGFTTRAGGVSQGRYASLNLGTTWGDDPEHTTENLRRVARSGGFAAAALSTVRQVHGDSVVTVTEPEHRAREADGLATAARIPLGALSADCACLLLADGQGRAAAAHAGWRGTVANMAAAAVNALVRLGAAPAALRVALGPCIGPCCFVVGEEVAMRFRPLVPDAVQRRADGQLVVDLRLANRTLLVQAGVAAQHIDSAQRSGAPSIDDAALCTCCDRERFFSYRRDGAQIGQQIAFVLGGTP